MSTNSTPPQDASPIDQVPAALERRFTRASYAVRAFELFARAVRVCRASKSGRVSSRTADLAVAEFVDYVQTAASPRRRALALRPGRRER